MSLIILLFAAGIVLIAAEVIVPGAVLGILGGLALAMGVILSFVRLGFQHGMLATLVAALVGALALYLEFVLLPKSRLARSLAVSGTAGGAGQPPVADRSVVGRQALTVTALAPSGLVEIDGRRYEAFARHGHSPKGERLEVVGIDNFRLIVSKPSLPASS